MQKIGELEVMLKHLSTQIEQLKDDSNGGTQVVNDRPPHY